jgi:hypothetical protein
MAAAPPSASTPSAAYSSKLVGDLMPLSSRAWARGAASQKNLRSFVAIRGLSNNAQSRNE